MKPLLWQRIRRNLLWIVLLLFVWLTCSGQAQAGGLSERLAAFPNWHGKLPVVTGRAVEMLDVSTFITYPPGSGLFQSSSSARSPISLSAVIPEGRSGDILG